MAPRLDRIERQTAEEAMRRLLAGARLDSFHVRERELTLCFVHGDLDDRPSDLWLQTGAPALVGGGELTEWPAPPADEPSFRAGRETLLPMLHRLIGDTVAAIAIAPDGALSVSFTGHTIVLMRAEPGADEIWSLSDRTPGTFDPQGWRVALGGDGRMTIRAPAR